MKEINKNSISGPDNSYKVILTQPIFYKDISLYTLFIGHSTSKFDPDVKDGDKVIVICDIVKPIKGKSFLVNGEILILDHVVDISPNCIQWQVILFIVLYYILEGGDTSISEPGLMETHCPEWWYY